MPQVEINIGAKLDPSLEASTQTAADQLEALSQTAIDGSAVSNAAIVAQAQNAANAAVAAAQAAAAAIAAINNGTTKNTNDNGKKQAANWRDVTGEISSAESQLVSDIFSKRQSLAADLEKIGTRLLESEISNALKTVTQHELSNMAMLASDQKASQEGLLYQLGAWIAEKAGFAEKEAAQTAEKEVGVAQRNAIQGAGNATGLMQQAAAKGQVVASDADQAASGAYASASQIPYVGWLMGPAAAATAAAAVMAFAEGGQLRVTSAQQPTMLHKDEMVWPGWAAHGARNMLASFSSGDFRVPQGGDAFNRAPSEATTHQWNYAPTIHGVAERDVMGELRNNAAEFASFVRGLSRGGAMKFG